MGKVRQYNVEGTLVEIPLCYDELSERELGILPDFIENPVYTPKGNPLMFTGEDACEYGESSDGTLCTDCGCCRFYRQTPNTLIGVCGHEKKRRDTPVDPAYDTDENKSNKGGK